MSTTFAVIYSYTDDTELREATRGAHRDYLRTLIDDGSLLAAGAFAPTEVPGGLLIYRAGSKADVQAIVDGDPYTTAGVVARSDIREWVPPLGPVAEALSGSD